MYPGLLLWNCYLTEQFRYFLYIAYMRTTVGCMYIMEHTNKPNLLEIICYIQSG